MLLLDAFFLLVGLGFGIFSFLRGRRKRSKGLKRFGAGIVGLILILICILVGRDIFFDRKVELNPWINNDAEITGAWGDRNLTLTLFSNHTFTYQTLTTSVKGTWGRDDYNLYLGGTNFGSQMRFIQFRGQYRLLTHPIGDSGSWNRNLGLSRN
jgi:hypothetical protein